MSEENRLLAALSGAAILLPIAAQAHNFSKGTFVPSVIDGIGASLNDPFTLLTLVPVGLMASMWDKEGMLRIWPALIAGMVIAVPCAAFSFPGIAIPALLVGATCALLAIISGRYPPALVMGLAALAGFLAIMATLEGHGFFTLPISIYIGILIGANFVVAAAAGVVRFWFDKVAAPWARLPVRILSSWTAAVTLMYLAFQLR